MRTYPVSCRDDTLKSSWFSLITVKHMFCGFYIRQAKKKQAISKAGITLSRISFTIRGDIRSTKLILRKKKIQSSNPSAWQINLSLHETEFHLTKSILYRAKVINIDRIVNRRFICWSIAIFFKLTFKGILCHEETLLKCGSEMIENESWQLYGSIRWSRALDFSRVFFFSK